MFDEMLFNPDTSKKLLPKWTISIPALVRTPLFSKNSNLGYVICFSEKNRSYFLRCFDPDTGKTIWDCHVPNGGYGAHAIGLKTIALSNSFTDITGINAETGSIDWIFKTHARIRSPIASINNNFIFSSGEEIYKITEEGEIINQFSLKDRYFFGLIKQLNDNLISLAATNDTFERSQVELISTSSEGKIKWKRNLGQGKIVSSETSGITILENKIYCAAGNSLNCIDADDGNFIWSRKLDGFVGRQVSTIFFEKIFTPSIDGSIYCNHAKDGQLLWKFSGATIVSTPVSIIGNWACACFDGKIHLINIETGVKFYSISTGHSPYSAITFWKNKAYLGGGDPPYYGRLYCFECADEDKIFEYFTEITTSPSTKQQDQINAEILISNPSNKILSLSLDTSAISASQTNGGTYVCKPISRSGDKFTFIIPVRKMLVPGIYSIECILRTENGYNISRTLLISIESTQQKPNRHVISGITPIIQEHYLYSGAAALQMLQQYYKQPVADQSDIREMADFVRNKNDYELFNTWRIALRRVISSNAQLIYELPEYGCVRDEP